MLRRLRSSVLAASLSVAILSPAAAQAPDPAAIAAATELYALMSPSLIDETIKSSTETLWPQIDASIPANVSQAARADLQQEFIRIIHDVMDEVIVDAPAIYARLFTVGELNDLLEFYRSPIGVKLLSVSPQITAATLELTSQAMAAHEADLGTAFEAVLRRHGY